MTENKLILPPLSLYIHFPWCVKKCPYCDFNSHKSGEELPENDYITALIEDLKNDLPLIQNRQINSIFIGGGTPSLISGSGITRLLESISTLVSFSDSIEITLEANPGTVEAKKFKAYRNAGINRLSLGMQSFNDKQLRFLKRIHSSQEAIAAFYTAKQAGFSNINIDLMHGLQNQTVETALGDLKTAIALAPTHISWYQLTIEPNTAFYNQKPDLPAIDQLGDIQLAGIELLSNNQYHQYEVSAFGQQDRQSKHNLNYWSFGDYLGIGAGAHGKITQPENGKIIRYNKTRQPNHYLNPEKPFVAQQLTIDKEDLPLEFMMNALRLKDGVEKSFFSARTGLSTDVIEKNLSRLEEKGLMIDIKNYIRPSQKGFDFLNSLLEEF